MADEKIKKRGEDRLNQLSKFQQVFPNNPTWGRIEYMIQSACADVSIQVKRLYVVGTKNMQSKFNTLNNSKTQFQIVLHESTLNQAENFSSVSEKGFKYPLQFDYGKIDLKNFQKANQGFYQMMICRAAVGKTYIFPAKNIGDMVPFEQKPQLMTSDFDSVCIYDESVSAKEFKQTYIIYEPQTKCLPEYIVHFVLDTTRYRELSQQILCQRCEENTARKYCETQDTYFCITCDHEHHGNRLSQKHKRSQLSEKPKTLSECPLHPTLKMELYCQQCNKTMCINCKVKGDHSEGENIMHSLTRITEKYNQTQKNLHEADTDLQNKRKLLIKSITIVESKLKQINKKNDQIQNQIYQIMQESLKKLQKITKKKMSLLMSDHIELKRRLDQIQWMQKYMHYEHDVLSPNDFLLSFSRYEACKRDILAKGFEVSNVMPDIRVEGRVNVLTEEESRMQSGAEPKKMEKNNQDFMKNALFEKTESKNANVMKSQLPYNQQIDQSKDQIVKSKNNLLNLSILKHL